MVYKGTPISIRRLGEMNNALTSEIEKELDDGIFFGKNVPFSIPEVVYDDISCKSVGYSWSTEKRNAPWTSQYSDDYFLHNIILSDARLSREILSPNIGVSTRARLWYIKLQEWKVKVGLLLKMACGGSLRDSEQLELLLFETPSARRNFFFVIDEVVMVPEYDKMSYSRSDTSIVPRVLYPRLAVIFAKYQLIVYPFETILRSLLCEDMKLYELTKWMMFVDENGRFPKSVLSKLLSKLMTDWFGHALGSSDIRHITQAIINHTTPPECMTIGLANFGTTSLNHSVVTGRKIYALFLNSFGNQHPEETEQYMRVST